MGEGGHLKKSSTGSIEVSARLGGASAREGPF
jgi:hypothetical protein